MPPKAIPIGVNNGRRVRLGLERRATHLHVMGASGQGKTKFVEHCIREDILAGHGVCLIDPEGDLYEKIVSWCAQNRVDRFANIHLFDPKQPSWRFRFNPLFVHPGEKPRHRIDNVIEALAQVWGGEDSKNTPAIRTTLRAIFTVLVQHGYSLAEAFYLTSTQDPYEIIEQLTASIPSRVMDEIWRGYKLAADKAPRDHQSEFGGARRRLSELLDDEEIREVLACYENPIDFKKCMDNRDIVLINLAPGAMGEEPARAFGALFVREMYYCAMRREPAAAQQNPFFAYIDECADFLTNDIPRILARTRKRGFHLILAHQWLEQLRERGDGIFHGVMGIQNKVIFGGLSDEDAVIMADQLFRTEYDLEVPVASLVRPSVVGYRRTWLQNWSEATVEGESFGESEGWSEGESVGQVTNSSTSISYVYDEYGFPIATGENTGVGNSSTGTYNTGLSSSSSYTTTSSNSNSHGASESLEPILKNTVSSVHGLENVRHMAIARLRSIPPQNAVVKGSASPSFDITTYFIEDVDVPETMVERFKQRVLEASPYTLPAESVKEVLRAHDETLTGFRSTIDIEPDDHSDILS